MLLLYHIIPFLPTTVPFYPSFTLPYPASHMLLTLLTYALHEEAQMQQAFFMRHLADVAFLRTLSRSKKGNIV